MDYIDPRSSLKPTPKKAKPKKKQTTKCSWCERKRERNDLCNVCRQKVESRARRLMEQKLEGDMEVIQKVMKYFNQNIPPTQLHNTQIKSLILECFPFLMLKFQSDNTYRGKKGNQCWCLPDSVLKKLITKCYKDKDKQPVIQKSGREELCDLLMGTVTKNFNKFGIKLIPDDEDTSMKTETNSGKIRDLKRRTMDDYTLSTLSPPRKRNRRDNHNHNNANGDGEGEVRIWGRSDTELLSFDITKLDSFLHKFENKVLNGTELQHVQADERVEFLKKRCKEFVKILTELRDYVLHLREKVINQDGNDDNSMILNAKNREITQLKQRIDNLSRAKGAESLMRCTTNLLSKLAPNPVDTKLLRSNMDKLEQYHNLACNELLDAVHCFESVGSKIGYIRSPDMTLKQYASHLQQALLHNQNHPTISLNRLYIDSKNKNNIHHTNNTNNNNNNNNNFTPIPQPIANTMPSTPTPSCMSMSVSSNNTINTPIPINNNNINNNNNTNNISPLMSHPFVPVNNNSHMHQFNYTNHNTNNMNNMNRRIQLQQHFNVNPTTQQRMSNLSANTINTHQILLTPITTNTMNTMNTYPLQIRNNPHNINNINNINSSNNIISPSIPLNAATLQSLDTLSVDETKFGSYFDFGVDTESESTDSLLHQYNVI